MSFVGDGEGEAEEEEEEVRTVLLWMSQSACPSCSSIPITEKNRAQRSQEQAGQIQSWCIIGKKEGECLGGGI